MKNKQKVREQFRNAVFKRDDYKCIMCGKAMSNDLKLDAHHITDRHEMPNGGYIVENGITLCDQPGGCHEKAEAFNRGLHVEDGYSPSELYELIGSSRSVAFAADAYNKLRTIG